MNRSAFNFISAALLSVLAVVAHATAFGQDVPGPGHAEVKRPSPVMPSPYDATTEELKQKVLRLDQKTHDLHQKLERPAYSRIDVYLGVKTPSFLVNRIEISIDGHTPETIKYDRRQSIALLNGSDRVLAASADPGLHHLHVKVTGRYADAKPDDPPVETSLDATFRKDQSAAELEFELASRRFSSDPVLHLLQLVPVNS